MNGDQKSGSMRKRSWIVAAAAMAVAAQAHANLTPPVGMARVGPGVLPLFDPPSPSETSARVGGFFLDKAPVTNAEYLEFVTAHPQWRRGTTPKLFADDHYLSHWDAALALGGRADPSGPVVRVSWFAAKAYCEAKGKRLPTENEWELAASASETQPLAPRDPQRDQTILGWYARPTPARMPPVMQQRPNFWGLYDLHGLIWEWVLDFNTRVVADGRQTEDGFVCGGATLRSADKSNYAAFMRMAFRASLRGNYTTADLGFRCAADAKTGSTS